MKRARIRKDLAPCITRYQNPILGVKLRKSSTNLPVYRVDCDGRIYLPFLEDTKSLRPKVVSLIEVQEVHVSEVGGPPRNIVGQTSYLYLANVATDSSLRRQSLWGMTICAAKSLQVISAYSACLSIPENGSKCGSNITYDIKDWHHTVKDEHFTLPGC